MKKVVIVGGTTYTTYYVWEGGKVIAEYGNAPAGGGGTRFYHPDRLSNRMTTDGSGAVKGTMDNLPFGEDGGVIGESEKHRFTNYERDGETGSDYAMNRQHHYATGRFLRPDPIAGSISNPQSFNRYAYTANDPVNLTDPTGLTLSIPGFCSAQFSSCGGGGDSGSGFSGTPFDDTPFGGGGGMPAGVAEGLAAYLGRLQNTYDAIAANRAIQGLPFDQALAVALAFQAANPNLQIQVAAVLGASFQSDTWPATLREMQRIAKALGGKVYGEKSTNVTYIIDVHMSYDEVIEKLKSLGFSWFPDLLKTHFGGSDYAANEAPWDHVTVGYPSGEVSTILPRGFVVIKEGFRPDLTPPWITIHIDPTNPRNHWIDYLPTPGYPH